MYKTYGEFSTTCHHFDYCPVVIARFQKAIINALIVCQYVCKLSLVYLNNANLTFGTTACSPDSTFGTNTGAMHNEHNPTVLHS